MLKEKIKTLAQQYEQEFIFIRRHLHAHPELSYQEFETSKYVQQKLSEWNIPYEVKATTGVVGLIEGRNPQSRIIALRADMDALPIEEENDVAYKSLNKGIMHACGHDVHTTCLLGASKILKELSNEWEGTVKLIFQPGEERNPGGASLMIKDGALENPKPQGILDFMFILLLLLASSALEKVGSWPALMKFLLPLKAKVDMQLLLISQQIPYW
jgi:hippurate hydrolase